MFANKAETIEADLAARKIPFKFNPSTGEFNFTDIKLRGVELGSEETRRTITEAVLKHYKESAQKPKLNLGADGLILISNQIDDTHSSDLSNARFGSTEQQGREISEGKAIVAAMLAYSERRRAQAAEKKNNGSIAKLANLLRTFLNSTKSNKSMTRH